VAPRACLIAIPLAIFFSTAHAGSYASGHVTTVYFPTAGNFIRFQLDSTPINPDGCTLSGWYFVEISPGSTVTNQFVSGLLEAHATARSVQFWISGCTANQYWGGTWPAAWDIFVFQN
jgi:hypothetical protein